MALQAYVTGASGFVGGHLVRELLRQDWQVTALVRESSRLDDLAGLNIDLQFGDITDADSVVRSMPSGVDGVFHVAASTNIWSRNNDLQTHINVDGTRNVVEAAAAADARRLVHTSSFVVWGFRPGVLTEECSPVADGVWINYVSTKRQAERIVKEAVAAGRLDAVILNPAHVLGPGDRHNWSRMMRMVNEERLPGVPPGSGAFADVREVARAHIEAFHRGRSGENYILGGEHAPFLELIRIAGDILGKPVPARPSPRWLLRAASGVYGMLAAVTGREPDLTPEGVAMITRHIECDSSRARRELGYRLTSVRELVRDTCEWMRNEGLLA